MNCCDFIIKSTCNKYFSANSFREHYSIAFLLQTLTLKTTKSTENSSTLCRLCYQEKKTFDHFAPRSAVKLCSKCNNGPCKSVVNFTLLYRLIPVLVQCLVLCVQCFCRVSVALSKFAESDKCIFAPSFCTLSCHFGIAT